jgi:hypothetical protein
MGEFMKWDPIQLEGRKQRYIVYAMDQGQTGPMETPIGPWGSTRNGFCTGMTIRWVAMHYDSKEFAFNQNTCELELDVMSLRDHTIYRDDPSPFPTDYANALARYGLTIDVGTQFRQQPINLDLLFTKVYNANRCFLILMNGANSAHTVALSVRYGQPKARWYYFDTNEGSFQFVGRDEAIMFLKNLFRFTEYTNRYPELYAIGVNRPHG